MRAHPHYNPFNVREPSEQPSWSLVFQNDHPLDLEIGFSNGTWLISYAKKYPERNIVGLEIRSKFISSTKEKIKTEKLSNTYVLQANANVHLKALFADRKFGKVFILFPDPWYKKGHLKRRVINQKFLDLIAAFLEIGGELQLATDKEVFAREMLTELETNSNFTNTSGKNNFAEQNIEGIETDIEIYHRKAGNKIYRMVFRRTPPHSASAESSPATAAGA